MPKMIFEQFKNNQELFDYMMRKLWEQNDFSVSNNRCRYRSDNETKRCAVGFVIPNSIYNASFENKSIFDIYWDIGNHIFIKNPDHSERFLTFLDEYKNFLTDVQAFIHDDMYCEYQLCNNKSKYNFRKELKTFVKNFVQQNGHKFNIKVPAFLR